MTTMHDNNSDEQQLCEKNTSEISKFNPCLEYKHKFSFKTINSADIKYSLLLYASTHIKRKSAIDMLSKAIDNMYIVKQIENGIFEFALINVNNSNYNNAFVISIYESKLYDIYDNLDVNNKIINNTTLLDSLYSGEIPPFFVAFMKPEQIHPKRWGAVLDRHVQRETAKHNVPASNMYTCSECGESKMLVTSMHSRSLDEPDTLFMTCLVCHKTTIQ